MIELALSKQFYSKRCLESNGGLWSSV